MVLIGGVLLVAAGRANAGVVANIVSTTASLAWVGVCGCWIDGRNSFADIWSVVVHSAWFARCLRCTDSKTGYMMKLSRQDWCQAGLMALAEKGPEALKIDHLCDILAVTKGSFYHYFKHREAYIDELLAFWHAHYTQYLIEVLSPQDHVKQRIAQLSAAVSEADHRTEVALRSWALSEPRVAEVVTAVDNKRLDYIAALLTELGYNPVDSDLLAKLLYAQTLGCQQLGKRLSIEEWKAIDGWFMHWLGHEQRYFNEY